MKENNDIYKYNVDCSNLKDRAIDEISIIFNKNGIKPILTIDKVLTHNFTLKPETINYEKFMELFGNKEEEYTEFCKVYNYLEKTTKSFKHCLTPVLDKSIEISENIAYKETENKLNYELDFNFITQLAERMAQNKHKYEPYNWQKLDNIAELKQALFRHVMEVMKDNYEDDNRLFGHLESIALNAMFINYQLNNLNNK